MKHIEYRSHHQIEIGDGEDTEIKMNLDFPAWVRPQLRLTGFSSSGHNFIDLERQYNQLRARLSKPLSERQSPVQIILEVDVVVNGQPQTKQFSIASKITRNLTDRIFLFDLVSGEEESLNKLIENGDTVEFAAGENCRIKIKTRHLIHIQTHSLILLLKKSDGLTFLHIVS